ncbi:hypothetical protein QR680_014768 [Steinernema hermaphroditum]|uniref:Fatty-acid and retinol-binding protein 1 n=1 Tax=Steinernema hermaphroditum TaxID=289476 RepID=A0AA39M4U1_9BILA|nr:hypothetical protein QR680_014768 [Steinernema hermaphroditum]
MYRNCAILVSTFVTIIVASENADVKLLTYLMPTLSQNFLISLTTEEAEALEKAGREADELRAQGKTLTDDDETALVKKYSSSAYSKTTKYEREFLDMLSSTSPNLRMAIDKILADKTNTNIGNLNAAELRDYMVVVANAFKELNANEKQELDETFPNYSSLLRNPDFEKLMEAPPHHQQKLAQIFIDNLEKS